MQTARTERRFEPTSATPPGLLLLVLNAGALSAGAGVVGFFLRARDPASAPLTTEALAFGALLLGVATALSARRGVAVRVGAAGVAFERGDLVRVPWHGIARIGLDGTAIRIEGTSDFGATISEQCNLHTHRIALAALVAEALVRVPSVVEANLVAHVGNDTTAEGDVLALEPLQIAGRRCAASGKPIAFEGDGMVCDRCERVYLRAAAPARCACGHDPIAR